MSATGRGGFSFIDRAVCSVGIGCAAMGFVAGCRQVLDVDGYGTADTCKAPPGNYVGKGGIEYHCKSCRDCADQACRDVVLNCSAEPACDAMAQCLANCEPDESTCRGRCNLSIPRTTEFDNLVACLANECPQCPASRLPMGGARCDACVAEQCPDAIDAFSKNKEALKLDRCELECKYEDGTPFCTCASEAEAADALAALRACVASSPDAGIPGDCRYACTEPAVDWSCLGHMQWPYPPASLGKLDLNLQLIDASSVTGSPLWNIDVSVCASPACANLSPAGETDMQGWAHLSIDKPTNLNSPIFFSYLVASDPPDGSAGTAIGSPGLLYFFPPIRTSPAWASRRVVSKTFADSVLKSIVTPDWQQKGGIVWSVVSCLHKYAAGVTVTVDDDSRVYYFAKDLTADRNLSQTSIAGIGFIPNVTPGLRTMQATANGMLIGAYPIQVIAGDVTHVTIAPAPLDTNQ